MSVIESVRAIMRDFNQTNWAELHARTGDWELFLARRAGAFNPMREGPVPTVAVDLPEPVSAPHLGIFRASVPDGQIVDAGALIGEVQVLDRVTPLRAEAAGSVSVLAQDDTMVEYGEAIYRLQ